MIPALPVMGASEFAHSMYQSICKGLYEALHGQLEKNFNGLFDSLNARVEWARTELTQQPQLWSPGGFQIIRNVAENVFIPIAGSIIIFIFCWEMCHLLQEGNRMQTVRPDSIAIHLLKLALCLFACIHSFDIVMGFYGIGAWATGRISGDAIGTFGEGLVLADIIPPVEDEYPFGMILDMAANLLVLFFGRIVTLACSAFVYIKVVFWFLEILLYASAAPIPFATWGSREWSQIGMNYTRRMLALSFEGFFMLLAFAVYGGVVSGIGEGSFLDTLVLVIGCGIGRFCPAQACKAG